MTVEMKPSTKGSVADDRVHEAVSRCLASCSYKFMFRKVTWHCHDGHLTLLGCVPSFHLKQQLQEFLRGIEHVTRITNSVDVVSSTGMSSARSHQRK